MKTIVIAILLIVSFTNANAQNIEESYDIGHKYFLQSKIDSALFYLTRSIKLQQEKKAKHYAPPYKDAGIILFKAEKYDHAYAFLNVYEDLAKNQQEDVDYEYWWIKGFLAQKVGYEAEDKAIEYYNKSLKYKEDNLPVHINLLNLYLPEQATGFGSKEKTFNADKAAFHYKRAKELGDKSIDEISYYTKLATAYKKKYNYTKAIEAYNKLAELSPDDLNILIEIANIYIYDLKNDEQAIITLNKILVKDPNNEEAIVRKGYHLYKIQNKIDDAILMLSKIKPKLMDFGEMGSKDVYSNREYCLANYYLTYIYVNQKDKSKAEETLQKMPKYFGFKYDNLVNEYNNLVDIVDKM